MKVIVFDAPMGVILPPVNSQLTVEEIAMRSVPSGSSYQIIDDSKLPSDRYFRNAWVNNDGDITIDMGKARLIHMQHIRVSRNEAFITLGFPDKLNLEVETLLSIELRNKLKTLRDIPQTTDLSGATTPEELKAIWPNGLIRG